MIQLPSAVQWLVFTLILVAAAVIARRTVPYLPSRRARRIVDRWIVPPVELLAAATAAGWILSRMIDGRDGWTSVIWGLLFLAFAWTGRSAIEDFVAGSLLRVEGRLERGQRLEAGNMSGRISGFGYRSVTVEAEDGASVRLPWRIVAREPIRLGDADAAVRAHSFTMLVPRTRPIERVLKDIPAAALISPWASTTRLPEVRLRTETEEGYLLDVTIHALDARFATRIEAGIRERMEIGD